MNNNEYTVNGMNSAQFAQFVRPQVEENEISPTFNDSVYFALPELLDDGCMKFKTKREKDVYLTGAITILSGCFSNVTGLYHGKMVNANLYSFIIAPPASNKSGLNYAKKLGEVIHREMMAENEAAIKSYRIEMAKYKATAKDNVMAEPPIEPIRKVLYIPANSSAAAIMKQVQDNGGGGVICETEADTLTNTFKQEWGNFDDLLRKAFHQEAFSYCRKTNNEYVEVNNPKIAVAISGTPAQVSRLLVSIENGLASRFMFYYYDSPGIWQDVSPKENKNLAPFFQELSERVQVLCQILNENRFEFELTESQWGMLNTLFASGLSNADEDLASTVKRLGLIVFKIAMVLSIAELECMPLENGVITCNDQCFSIAMLMAEVFQVHADLTYKALLVPKGKPVDGFKMRFYEALPSNTTFERKEAVEIGSYLTLADRTVDKYLKQFCQSGTLVLAKYGTYMKM